MLFIRVLQRLVVVIVWLLVMSILGYVIAVINNAPLISFSVENYWLFLYSIFTQKYYYFHYMHTSYIIRQIITTLELVLVSLAWSMIVSWILVVATLKHNRLRRWLFTFFSFTRVAPFFVLALLLNTGVGEHLTSRIQKLDDTAALESASRIWAIITNGENGSAPAPELLFNFMSIALTASLFILPTVYIMVARVTQQVTNYTYVTALTNKWSSFDIMHRMVNHRLIPVFLNEIPPVIASFMMIIGLLEYLFRWKGIGYAVLNFIAYRQYYGVEIGLCIFMLGSCLILIYATCIFLRNLYDLNKTKELPYEID